MKIVQEFTILYWIRLKQFELYLKCSSNFEKVIITFKKCDDFVKKEEYNLLTKLINTLVGVLLVIAILLMIIIPDKSDLPTLIALFSF